MDCTNLKSSAGGDKHLGVKDILELIELDDPVNIVIESHDILEVLSPDTSPDESDSEGTESEMEQLRVSEVCNESTTPYIITDKATLQSEEDDTLDNMFVVPAIRDDDGMQTPPTPLSSPSAPPPSDALVVKPTIKRGRPSVC